MVCCHLTFRRHTRTDLNVGLLDHHPRLDRPSATATILRCEHPLAVGLSKSFDRNDADTRLVVTAVTRSEPNTPSRLDLCQNCLSLIIIGWVTTYPELHFSRSIGLHSITSIDRIIAIDHLDKSMALVDVDNARLNQPKPIE